MRRDYRPIHVCCLNCGIKLKSVTVQQCCPLHQILCTRCHTWTRLTIDGASGKVVVSGECRVEARDVMDLVHNWCTRCRINNPSPKNKPEHEYVFKVTLYKPSKDSDGYPTLAAYKMTCDESGHMLDYLRNQGFFAVAKYSLVV